MNKRRIGKAQLIIGIIVLILGIAGLITSWIWFNNVIERFPQSMDFSEDYTRETCPECSEAEIKMFGVLRINMEVSGMYMLISVIISLAGLSALFILISLLFITQGLVNSSEIR